MPARRIASGIAPLALLLVATSVSAQAQLLMVTPAETKLEGNFARVQLVVTAADASGLVNERSEDLTGQAKFASSDANIVSVNERGLLLAQTRSISQHELDQNEAAVASASALAEAAKARLATVSAPARDDDLGIAEAKLASAEAKLRIAQAALARTKIIAPSDGLVVLLASRSK